MPGSQTGASSTGASFWVSQSTSARTCGGISSRSTKTMAPTTTIITGTSSAGVEIGSVTTITLDQQRYVGHVTMQINASVNALPVDSAAMILTQGMLGQQYIGISIGAEEKMLSDGNRFKSTQSALVLEDLIGKFLTVPILRGLTQRIHFNPSLSTITPANIDLVYFLVIDALRRVNSIHRNMIQLVSGLHFPTS